MIDDFDSPAFVMHRLNRIECDLAARQNDYENAARRWYEAQREIGRIRAVALLESTEKSITEKKARADLKAYEVPGAAWEAEYEALKAVIRVLEGRAMINQSLLKAHGRI